MRFLAITAAIILALTLVGCEEGEEIDVDPGTSRDIFLEVTSTQPITAGDPVEVRATVTEDGSPVVAEDVTFSASVNSQDRPAIPNPVNTSILGTADTTISTSSADRSLVITASSGTATSNTVTQTLEPRP